MRKCLILLLLSAQICFAHRHHKRHRPKPSHAKQVAQNQVTEQLHLLRIRDSKQLGTLIRAGRLVPIMNTEALFAEPGLPIERRYCLPSTLVFVEELSVRYHETFNVPIIITSAVRTLQVQRRLLRFNSSAAPLHGETASVHPTGAAVDISWRRMTNEQREFTERMLEVYALYRQIIYIKEYKQPCFHVFIVPY